MYKLTANQVRLLMALRNHKKPIVIGTGPAGSGKTLLACKHAAESLVDRSCSKIVLTRPTVTADEELGFLPGGINEKMMPWTQPMIDILNVHFKHDRLDRLFETNRIEIAPLAYMRGRTFDDSVIVADEMQNSTPNQMKMLLTRIGKGSKLIVTGDEEQCDIQESGLVDLVTRMHLTDINTLKHIDYVKLGDADIKRHEAVKEVLEVLYK